METRRGGRRSGLPRAPRTSQGHDLHRRDKKKIGGTNGAVSRHRAPPHPLLPTDGLLQNIRRDGHASECVCKAMGVHRGNGPVARRRDCFFRIFGTPPHGPGERERQRGTRGCACERAHSGSPPRSCDWVQFTRIRSLGREDRPPYCQRQASLAGPGTPPPPLPNSVTTDGTATSATRSTA